MSKAHKAALAQGRRESRAIKAYLEALESRRPGRPVTPESLEDRITALDRKINQEEDSLRRVELRQQRLDAERDLRQLDSRANLKDLEAAFIENARSYSDRKGISYTAWRESGVSAAVLRDAGIPRTRRS